MVHSVRPEGCAWDLAMKRVGVTQEEAELLGNRPIFDYKNC